MRILGLDVGSKTIGVAVSDPMGWTAQGVATLARKNEVADFEALAKWVREYEVKTLVIGLPLHLNGSEGTQAQAVRQFSQKLAAHLGGGIPIILLDERLSTVGAERSLLEADLSRSRRRQVIDKMAAVFILQGYLDSQPSTS